MTLSSLIIPRIDPNTPVPPTFVLFPLATGALTNPISHLARLYSLAEVTQEDIFAWPALVDENYLSLLEQEVVDQAAMVVAYYFYNLLRQVEDQIWWTGHYGRIECERLLGLIAPDFQRFLPEQKAEIVAYQ